MHPSDSDLPEINPQNPMTYQSRDTTNPISAQPPDLLLLNAKVLTISQSQPTAEAVAVQGASILAVGSGNDLAALAGPNTRTIDCQGMTLLPGFIDAHCHVLATASAMQGVDCGPGDVASIQELQLALRSRADVTPQGDWVRGFGYDDLALKERRHPNRWDLDQAAPDHPVRLDHRSGHATVLNSPGLAQAGIDRATPDPIEAVIQREDATGEPTGLLLEMGGFLAERLRNQKNRENQVAGVNQLSRRLLSYGITSVQDAGPHNNLERWTAFKKLKSAGSFQPRITMMAGSAYLNDFSSDGLAFGSGGYWLRLGHLKIMLTLTTGQLHPNTDDLQRLISESRKKGFPVAIHAVEIEAVEAAARGVAGIPPTPLYERGGNPSNGAYRPKGRIEHCSECPPEVAALVRKCGAGVVTQPGFVYWNGDNYLERVESSMSEWLYPVGGLSRAGVSVAFGSDSPVIDPNPWPGIYSAVTGLTRSGQSFRGDANKGSASSQSVSLESALRMYTLGAALAEGTQGIKGSIEPGMLADLTLLDADVEGLEPADLKQVQSVLTIIEGRLVWEA